MAEEWLRKSHAFIGQVTIDDGWMRAPVFLQPNLDLHIFLPGLYEQIPEFIKGRIEDWNIKIIDGATLISHSHGNIGSLNKSAIMLMDKEEKNLFLQENQNKIWTEITFTPRTVLFEKDDLPSNIPEW